MRAIKSFFDNMRDRARFYEMVNSERTMLYKNINQYGPEQYKNEKYIIISRLFYIAVSEEYRSSVDFESELRYSHKRLPWVFTGESTLE